MEETKGANPKIIVAVQMTSIGVILIILGATVTILSLLSMSGVAETINPWTPYIKTCSHISNVAIILLGVVFLIGGIIRHKQVKSQE